MSLWSRDMLGCHRELSTSPVLCRRSLCSGGVWCSLKVWKLHCSLHQPLLCSDFITGFLMPLLHVVFRELQLQHSRGNSHLTSREWIKPGQAKANPDKPLDPALPCKYKVYGLLLLMAKIIFTVYLLHPVSYSLSLNIQYCHRWNLNLRLLRCLSCWVEEDLVQGDSLLRVYAIYPSGLPSRKESLLSRRISKTTYLGGTNVKPRLEANQQTQSE